MTVSGRSLDRPVQCLNMDDMDVRVSLVSGGSRGIGSGITRALVRRGNRVGCTYRSDRKAAERLAAEAPGRVLPIAFDLTDESSAPAAVLEVVNSWGRLDSIILNAGEWSGGLLAGSDPEAWWRIVETNVKGTVALARAALPHLTGGWSRGCSPGIVIVSSVVGIIGHPGDTAYASSKSALIGFARSLAKEVASQGIRVNVLAPGFVSTDMTDRVPASARKRIESETILGRFGTVDEIAASAVFLSEDATFCTGTILTADGGWSI
jgi:3-oxoacyl-[acyl-carrier protein] reductase